MAKGLGAIIAEVALDQKRRALDSLEAPACPLCGEPMENDGAGWFCYSDPKTGKCPKLGELRDAMYAHAGEEFIWNGGTNDTFQFQEFGYILDQTGEKPVILASLFTVRGGSGRTNLKIRTYGDVRDADIPELIQRHGWMFWDWVEPICHKEQD